MPAIQILKKKLRGIRSTQKLSKAMKTASAVKYSRLTAVYNGYVQYSKHCMSIYEKYGNELNNVLPQGDPSAPQCLIVLASNKGMCGGFNSEVLSFAEREIKSAENAYFLIPCGKRAISYFKDKQIPFEKSFVFDDVPKYEEADIVIQEISNLRAQRQISSVKIIYPEYTNMMKQTPVLREMFAHHPGRAEAGEVLLIPDKPTVIKGMAERIFHAVVYGVILETALGAQAATLMTMRSAYDTATEYSDALEREINRKRQSQVTADVIETSAESSS